LFQEFLFELIIKLGICNVGHNQLSILELGEIGGAVDDQIPYAELFWFEATLEYLEYITIFLRKGACLETYSAT
jgi:hypothetical protein